VPTMAPQPPARPAIGLTAPAPVVPDAATAAAPPPRKGGRDAQSVAPGFSIQ
jgi:pilus assembly protein CpaC